MSTATSSTTRHLRADRVTERLQDVGADLILIGDLVNVRYLTGYSGSNGLALVGPRQRTFITDFRYVEQAAEEVDGTFARIEAPQDLLQSIADVLPPGRLRLAFEAEHVSVRDRARLIELLGDDVTLIEVQGIVEDLRAVKDEEELSRIKEATKLADAAFEEVIEQGLVGRTEREVALELENAMRRLGAERVSFETIVAAGSHGALPHAAARPVEIERGQMVVIDWGAQLEGYCSDCTRTVATGEPGEQEREIYALVLKAQLAGLEAVTAGAGCQAVDAVAREVIVAAGQGEHFGHGLGHGVGLEVHEGPRLSFRAAPGETLASGNVVTVEPGIYLPGAFGVRIEDLVVARSDSTEILTGLSKELTVVG